MKKLNIKYKISLPFILLSIAILFFDNFKNFFIYLIVVAIHEFAHYIVAKKLGYKLGNFYLMPYGVCLNYESNVFCGNDELVIAISGPLINFFLCILCVAIWWIFPSTYYYLDYFCFCNLVLGGFNILPCFPLDGGRILVFLLSKAVDRIKAIKVTHLLNYIFSFILVVLFIFSVFKEINFSYIFIAIFLFLGCINPQKYSKYEYLSLSVSRKKIYQKGCNVKIFAISSSISLYKIIAKFSKFKFNIVYVILKNGSVKVLSENNINNLAIKYSPTMSIEEIISLK